MTISTTGGNDKRNKDYADDYDDLETRSEAFELATFTPMRRPRGHSQPELELAEEANTEVVDSDDQY